MGESRVETHIGLRVRRQQTQPRTTLRRRSTAAVAALTVALAGLTLVGAGPAEAEATRTVAFYSMDEPAGATVLVDSSGNNRNGTIGSSVTTGATFEGATAHRFPTLLPGDRIADPGHTDRVPHTTLFNPDAGDFSVTIRLRTRNSFGNVIQKGQGTAVGGYWKFEIPGGLPRCLFRGATGASRTGYANVDVSDNRWHTITCNRTSSYVEMYVDGVRTSRAFGQTGTIGNNAQLSIGGKSQCDGVNTTCDYFGGDIDYVKISKGDTDVPNALPVAAIGAECTGLVCSFDGSGSRDSDGAVQTYDWDFGNGVTRSTGSIRTTTYTYPEAGSYTASLTVTDDRGGRSTATRVVTVEPVDEVISYVGRATSNANVRTHSVTVPSTVQAGDTLVLLLSQNTHAAAGDPTNMTGWTRLQRIDAGFATTTAWTKTAAAGDAGRAIRVTLAAQSKGNFVVAAYRGTSGLSAFAGVAQTVSSTQRTTPVVPVAAAQSWAVSYWMHGDSASTQLVAPEGVQVRSNSSQTGGGRVTGLLADTAASLPAGSYGGLTARGSANSTTGTAWTFVLAPQQ